MKQTVESEIIGPEQRQLWPELELISHDQKLAAFVLSVISSESSEQLETQPSSKPEIINHHSPEGLARLTELLKQCQRGEAQYDPDQWEASHAELVEFAGWMANVPETEEAVITHVATILSQIVPDLPQEKIVSLISATSIAKDLAAMAHEARILGSTPEKIEEDARWIWFPEDKLLVKMIGKDAYYLLTVKSRAVGLIPFEALDKLRELKIRCAGASAVVHLLDLLAGLGAEDIRWWDAGKADPSNLGRLGRVGKVRRIGKGKATSLETELLNAYPYAKFEGSQGKVVATQEEVRNSEDISYADFLADADIAIEVIDSAQGKIDLRLYIKQQNSEVKVIYLADVSDAFVRIEDTKTGNHFGQELPESHFTELSRQFAEIQRMPNGPEKDAKKNQLNITAVVHMLYKQFPPEHQLQFLYIVGQLTPFWAQTAISARESAAIGARLLLEMLVKNTEATDVTHTSETVSHSLFDELSSEQLTTQKILMSRIFGLPLDLYEE